MQEKTWGGNRSSEFVEVEKVHPQLARAGELSPVS
jgi:hypothetical protein